MITFRSIDLQQDRDFILDAHCHLLFEGADPGERRQGYLRFKEQWLSTCQPSMHIEAIRQSIQTEDAVVEVITVGSTAAGIAWTSFHEVAGYGTVYAQLRELVLNPGFQRQGLGRLTLHHIEQLAAERGATSLRSVGSARSEAVRAFHASGGFYPVQTVFEKPIAVATTEAVSFNTPALLRS